MKIEGMVRNRRLQVFINSGSKHNFLDVSIVEQMGCLTAKISTMKVIKANGNTMYCSKICRGFSWSMQRESFSAYVFLIPFESYHLVLGGQWIIPWVI